MAYVHPIDQLHAELKGRPFQLSEFCPRCQDRQTFYFDRKAEFMDVRYYECWVCDWELEK